VEQQSIHLLKQLFKIWSGVSVETLDWLPASGSYRQYCRMKAGNLSALGVLNRDHRENQAFFSFTRSFREAGLPVPELFLTLPESGLYLLEDLGEE